MSEYIKKYERLLGQDLIKKGKNYFALCPFHAESNPSFCIYPDTGRFHCFGCGKSGNFADFLRLIKDPEKEPKDTEDENVQPGRKKASPDDYQKHIEYIYFSPTGEKLYVKHRYENPRRDDIPKKTFLIEFYEGNKNKNLHFYGLPALPALSENHETEIWFAEGEKCVEAILMAMEQSEQNYDAVVLGYVFGDKEFESLVSLYPEFCKLFIGRKSVIFADNDEIGRKKAEKVIEWLKKLKVKKIDIVQFKNYRQGFDIADFLEEHTLSDALILSENVFEKRMFSGSVYDFISEEDETEDVRIGGNFQITQGVITLLAGTGGVGKSMLSIYLACELLFEGKNVMIVSLEDSIRQIKKRFRHIFHRFSKKIPENSILTVVEYTDSDENISELLKDAFTDHDVVFIDPIAALLRNENDNSEIAKLVRTLTTIVQKYNKNLILVHHTKKYLMGNSKDRELTKEDLYEAVRGASALANAVKHIMLVRRLKEDIRHLEVITLKNNYFHLNNDFIVKNILDFDSELIAPIELVPFVFSADTTDIDKKQVKKKQKPKNNENMQGLYKKGVSFDFEE
ncbi:hypothetical protein TdN_19730 [Thermodesulfovibrio sp. TK110]